jgi:hypothetical protein
LGSRRTKFIRYVDNNGRVRCPSRPNLAMHPGTRLVRVTPQTGMIKFELPLIHSLLFILQGLG